MLKVIQVIFILGISFQLSFYPPLTLNAQIEECNVDSIQSLDSLCSCPEGTLRVLSTESFNCLSATSYKENAPAQTQDIPAQSSGGVISIGTGQSIISTISSQASSSSVDTITNILAQKYEISDPFICGGSFTGKTNNPNAMSVNYILFKTLTGAKAYEFNTIVKSDRTFEYFIDYSKVLPDSYNVVYYGVNVNGQPENPGNSYIANITNNCATLTSEVNGTQTQNAVTVMAAPNVELSKGASTIRTGAQSFNIFVFAFFLILSWKVSFSG
jgi:hypothetical protein